ncbi:receptor-like protein Cf-9 [Capsicum chacoense]
MPHHKTSSWKMSRDCCSWDGVTCDEMTGHVTCSQLVGKIDSNSSLFQLSHLQRLDLSYNNFSGSHIFPEFGRFSSLTHLNLFKSSFSGQIPLEISHLSKLQSLSLSPSSETSLRLAARDFKLLLQNLTKLTDLQLNGINISSTITLNFFSHLTTLRLLSLSNCNLRGPIPESLSNLTRLELLVLDGNTLNGTMPSWMFSQLPSLRYLILRNNHFSGHLPNSIQNLVNLIKLDLSFNNFSGYVEVSLFSDLKQLGVLDLSYNSISLTNENKVNVTWLESLDKLGLAACEVKELEFLRSAKQLQELDLSNNKLQGRIPDWAWV